MYDRKSDPEAKVPSLIKKYYVCKTAKLIPMGKTDPDLKTLNSSRLVCKIDNITVMILTSVFIILSYFALRFYRCNYFYSSQNLHEEIMLTVVCGKVD